MAILLLSGLRWGSTLLECSLSRNLEGACEVRRSSILDCNTMPNTYCRASKGVFCLAGEVGRGAISGTFAVTSNLVQRSGRT